MFNSVSVINLSVRNGTGDGTETVPTATLLAMILLLRFLALLVQRYPLFHGRALLPGAFVFGLLRPLP